jgi:hypothetical protein
MRGRVGQEEQEGEEKNAKCAVEWDKKNKKVRRKMQLTKVRRRQGEQEEQEGEEQEGEEQEVGERLRRRMRTRR